MLIVAVTHRSVLIVCVSQHIISCFFVFVFAVCHAELNAIMNKNSADVKGCTMYVALFPCNECAKLIIQAGESVSMERLFLGVCMCRCSSPYFCSHCIIVELTYSPANWHPYFISSINVLCMLVCSGSKECFVVL